MRRDVVTRAKNRGDLAPPVEVPRWICFFGTQLVVVATMNEHDARALVRDRLREKNVAHYAREIRVRQLRTSDLDLIESWEESHASMRTNRRPVHQGSTGRVIPA